MPIYPLNFVAKGFGHDTINQQRGKVMKVMTTITHLNAGELLITFNSILSAQNFRDIYGGWLFDNRVCLMFSDSELEYFCTLSDYVLENSNVVSVRKTSNGVMEYYG